jgi:dipeptidyl aminopeptidase/acylaminoacyl peptidase
MMRKSLLSILLLSLAINPASSGPGEQVVTFASGTERVVGTLTLPVEPHPPIILMLHGFAGSGDEEGIFPNAAAAFAAAGLASLRIDFRGAGESGGTFADPTFSRQVEDALAAMRFITQNGNLNSDKMGLLGVSQGGMIAALAAARSGRPHALALWSAVADPPATYEHILGRDAIVRGLASGEAGVKASGVHLRQTFFEEIYKTFPLQEIENYKGALFAGQGDRDDVVGPDSGDKYVEAHRGGQVWHRDMDHDFNLGRGPADLDALIEETSRFFLNSLRTPHAPGGAS